MNLTARPTCTHCLADQEQRAEEDRQRHLALVDAYFAEPIALLDHAERAAALVVSTARGQGERL